VARVLDEQASLALAEKAMASQALRCRVLEQITRPGIAADCAGADGRGLVDPPMRDILTRDWRYRSAASVNSCA